MPQEYEYEPTLQEIAAECERIQATWSEVDRRQRIGYLDDHPVYCKRRVRVCGDGRALR